jgi:hypothetical protein
MVPILYNLKSTNMKIQLKIVAMLSAVSFFLFMGCKKHDRALYITIVETTTAISEEHGYTGTGPFTITGGITTAGTFVMDVAFVADSFYCTNKLTAPEGTFTTNMRCSATNMTGAWTVLSGTGQYKHLTGGGTLVMTSPPDVETLTGTVWLHQ